MVKGIIATIIGLILLIVVGTWVGYLGTRHGWWRTENAAPVPTASPSPSTPNGSTNTPTPPTPPPQLKEGGAMKRQTNVSCVGRPKGTPFWCGPNSPTEQCVCP